MKRTPVVIVLTLASMMAAKTSPQDSPPDVEIRAVSASGPAPSGRFCVGPRNSVRAQVVLNHGAVRRDVPLRLVLVLPNGDPAGVLLAQGSASFSPGATSTSLTFVNVEVPERLRGRGAALEVRANVGGGMGERNLANNVAMLDLDRVTDWDCHR
jgi:hypothetical protein